MNNEKIFEQYITSEILNNIVGRHMNHLNESRERISERTRSYPTTYDEYSAMPLNDRLTSAVSIFHSEVPGKRRGSDTPKNPFTFDISSLTGIKAGSVEAQIVYSEGEWINALNDTDITKLPHLGISLRTSLEGNQLNDHLADLEAIHHYEESGGYKNYKYTYTSFQVVERGFRKNSTEDPDNPLFRDVVKIVDKGIEALYKERLMARIEKLGNIAVNT